jgi:hypothetical protein
MFATVLTRRQWLRQTVSRLAQALAPPAGPAVPLKRPRLAHLAQPDAALPRFVAECTVARRYLDLLGDLDWDHCPERNPHRAWPGPAPIPRASFVGAFLVQIDQHLAYMPRLRQYPVDHPALIWILGFPLVPSSEYSWGFDAAASLPTARHFGRVLRELDNAALQFLFDGTVHLLQNELPPDVAFGAAISGDTKHIIAWVQDLRQPQGLGA